LAQLRRCGQPNGSWLAHEPFFFKHAYPFVYRGIVHFGRRASLRKDFPCRCAGEAELRLGPRRWAEASGRSTTGSRGRDWRKERILNLLRPFPV
jgi:hypothetical protein